MPTVVTKTIAATSSPTTPDYSTLQAWEDALPANLVTADEQHIGECLDQGEFTGTGNLVNFAGQTTDATRNIILRCATGASFKDKAGVRTSALFYNASNGVAIRRTSGYGAVIVLNSANVTLEGLQVRHVNAGNGVTVQVISPGGASFTIDSCILENQFSSGCIEWLAAGTLKNSLLVSTSANPITSNVSKNIYGCTLISLNSASAGITMGGGYTTLVVKNTAVFGCTSFNSGTPTTTGSGYNATDASSAAGLNNQTSLTFADQFESTTNDFRTLSTSDLRAGLPDSTNTPDDITGLTRDTDISWIGCWEIAVEAVTLIPRQWFAEGAQIYEESRLEYFVEGAQISEDPEVQGGAAPVYPDWVVYDALRQRRRRHRRATT